MHNKEVMWRAWLADWGPSYFSGWEEEYAWLAAGCSL
jgi:hypothetical protein